MIHRGGDLIQRALDWVERLLWQKQDDALAAEGWQVVRVGRWQRTYRHPALVRAATAHGERQRQGRVYQRRINQRRINSGGAGQGRDWEQVS